MPIAFLALGVQPCLASNGNIWLPDFVILFLRIFLNAARINREETKKKNNIYEWIIFSLPIIASKVMATWLGIQNEEYFA